MADRERLIELLRDTFEYTRGVCISFDEAVEINADHLLANGVIVPPCYIGQAIWHLCEHYDRSVEIKKGKISMLQQKANKTWKFRITINSSVWDFTVDDIGKTVFLTKEEAEAKLKEREGK